MGGSSLTTVAVPPLTVEHVYLSPGEAPETGSFLVEDLRRYFAHFGFSSRPTDTSLPRTPEGPGPAAQGEEATTLVVQALLGSRKTRLGAEPPPRSRQVLHERVRRMITRGGPIDAFLTWGPRKFYADTVDGISDVAEAAALARLIEIHHAVAAVHPAGLRVTLFLEDFEGQVIERASAAAFAPYLESLEALVRVAVPGSAIRCVRTSDLLARDPARCAEITRRIEANYRALRRYWEAVEHRPGSDVERESLEVLADLGFDGPIGVATKRFYLGRLHRLLGDRLDEDQRVQMVLRLFACVLMHRQVDFFRIEAGVDPIKLSFLPLVGGPEHLGDGRIDLRVISTDVSRRNIAPWSAKGYLRSRGGRFLPALRPWREPLPGAAQLVPGALRFCRGPIAATIRADVLREPR